ncbi:hypothetical protein MMC11_004432 [Xylographa trunciseda]|nr:hypothetical protein [Xylographa trunciseda]
MARIRKQDIRQDGLVGGAARQSQLENSLPQANSTDFRTSSLGEFDPGSSPAATDSSELTSPATPPTPLRSPGNHSFSPRRLNDSSFTIPTESLHPLGSEMGDRNSALSRESSTGELHTDAFDTRTNINHDRSLSNVSSQDDVISSNSLHQVTSNDTDQTGNLSTDSLESYEIVPSQADRTERLALTDSETEKDRLVDGFVLPSIPPSDPPTAQDWEDYREIFTKLYRAEGKKLKDVKKIMEERYSFCATERMYKKRIADWGLRKYSGRNKARTSSNEDGTRRPTVGNQGSSARRPRRSTRGASVAQSENQFALARNRRAIEQDLDKYLQSKVQNLNYTRFRTISKDLENFEIILTQIDSYYNSYQPSDWRRTFPKTARASIKEIPLCFDMQVVTQTAATAMVRHPGEVFNRIHMAAELLRINTPETCKLAWKIINDAFEMVKSVLVQQHPQLLRYLFMQFWDHTFDAHPDIRRHLFAITSEMAEVCLGPRHPITLIARLLPKIKDGSLICELAWKRNLDTFDALLGPDHDESLRSKMALTGNLIDADRYDDAERVLGQIVGLFEPDSTAYYYRAALCRIAWLHKLRFKFQEAETCFISLLEKCRTYNNNHPESTLDEVYIAATIHLAQIRAGRDYQQGKRLLQEAMELCIRTMGPDHAYTYTIRSELSNWKQVAETDTLLHGFVIETTEEP